MFAPSAGLRRGALALVAVLLVWAAFAAFTRGTLVMALGGRFDFTPSLIGAAAFWAGESPYTAAVTLRVQQAMFGGALPAGEDEQRVAHPAYTAVLIAPLLLVSPEMAIALWSSLQLLLLICTPFLWLSIFGWSPKPLLAAALLLSLLLLYRYPIIIYVLGQFVGTVLFGFSLAIWCLRRGHRAWAGAALVLCMMPPSYGAALVALALVGEVVRGRWRAALVFCGLMGAVTLFSVARIGWWLPDWLATLNAYREYANPYFPLGLLPSWGQLIIAALALAALAWLTWRWLRAPSDETWQDFLCAALLVLALLLPQTGAYYLACLMIVAIAAAMRIDRAPRGRWLGALLWLAFAASPWVWFLLPARDRTEVLFVPLAASLVWGWSRRDALRRALSRNPRT